MVQFGLMGWRMEATRNLACVIGRVFGLSVLITLALSTLPAQAQNPPPVPSENEVPIALLVDVTSDQVLYAREANRRFVPASITKVMTLFHAFELIEEGNLNARQQFQMRPETWDIWYRRGSTMFIEAEDRVAVDDLLMGIANVSANDGSMVLAEGHAGSLDSWLEGMNSRAKALGMTGSHFATPNGWPDEGRTFTTAHDLVTLAKALSSRHPEKYARYIGQSGFRYNAIGQSNRDPMIGRVEGADGIKTGYTNEAGLGYLGSAKRGGQRLVVVIAGANSESIRGEAARGLIEWGFSAFDRIQVARQGELVGAARVQNGIASSVNLQTERPVFVNVPSKSARDMRVSVAYDGPLRAPIEAGARVATLLVEFPGSEPARIPLLAETSVEKAGFLTRIWNGVTGWFG